MTHERVSVDFRADRVGEWSPDTTATVTRAEIATFAAATGEIDGRLLDGDLSSIVFGVVPSWQEVASVFRSVAPEEHQHRVVHGEHRIECARPLVPGDTLTTRSTVSAIRPTSTGTIVSVDVESVDANGDLVVRQVSTGFYIGVTTTVSVGREAMRSIPAAGAAADGAGTDVRIATDLALPARYAEASGDRSAIHLDARAARTIGLPGVILHGMCTLALASRAIVSLSGENPTVVRSLACRFSGVALPGDDLVVRVGDGIFTAVSPTGTTVLSAGSFDTGAVRASLAGRIH